MGHQSQVAESLPRFEDTPTLSPRRTETAGAGVGDAAGASPGGVDLDAHVSPTTSPVSPVSPVGPVGPPGLVRGDSQFETGLSAALSKFSAVPPPPILPPSSFPDSHACGPPNFRQNI